MVFGVLALLIILLFSVLTITGEDGILRLVELKKIKTRLEEENRKLLQHNLAYRQEIKSLYQIQSVEARAREAMGWVYKDEIIYVDSAL